jgi:hypothetical protein
MKARTVLLGLLAAITGCAPSAPPRPRPVALAQPPRVAVLAFAARAEAEPGGVGAIPAELGTALARELSRLLGEAGLPVVDPDRVFAATPPPGTSDVGPGQATRVARRLGASLVVLGVVTRYHEREGTAWAVRNPASVAYQATLVRADDGAVLSLDRFDYTQRSLSENLLDLPRFVRGGGRWLTCQEILDGALAATAERFARSLASGASGQAGPR